MLAHIASSLAKALAEHGIVECDCLRFTTRTAIVTAAWDLLAPVEDTRVTKKDLHKRARQVRLSSRSDGKFDVDALHALHSGVGINLFFA